VVYAKTPHKPIKLAAILPFAAKSYQRRFTLTQLFGRLALPLPTGVRKSPVSDWSFSMPDRRQSARDKVIYSGGAEVAEGASSRDCAVRNISEPGTRLESGDDTRLPGQPIRLMIAKGIYSSLAGIIRWRDKFVDVAFSPESPYELPGSDLARRLRRIEKKKRKLQRRINRLIGEG
jgi:hypothetical protein